EIYTISVGSGLGGDHCEVRMVCAKVTDVGNWLAVTPTVKAWVSMLPSDEVAVTLKLTEGSEDALSVPVPERVMTPVLALMAKRESSML
ncbi:hypothetical protein, partial [Mesorhizobium sp. M2D.F.Ca.ET.140.01.1.1]|uniref:hypothetical protein n=1 Tax=Mesorhizobium sp. M2D.F.Ca.ET.140.01.1.1 TaxID=2496664 RepID=UPI0016777036